MWSVQPRVAVLFGSVARGAMELDSDVDIFVVRPTDAPASEGWDSDVRSLEDDATRWTGNDVRVLEMTEAHVERHGANEPVLRDILSEGVRLAGDLEWLRRTVRRASTPGSG
jgi:predicted nucleotidyltransferase